MSKYPTNLTCVSIVSLDGSKTDYLSQTDWFEEFKSNCNKPGAVFSNLKVYTGNTLSGEIRDIYFNINIILIFHESLFRMDYGNGEDMIKL